MAKKSYQERVREQRELDILRVASHMIHEHGYSQLNMDDLAGQVGISKSTLYQHFSSKQEMVLRVLLRNFDLLDQQMDDATGTPIERLEELLRYILRTASAPGDFATTLVRDEVVALFRSHPAMRPRLNRCYVTLNEWIDAAKANHTIRHDLHNSVIISAMFGLLSVLDSPDILRDPLNTDSLIDQTVMLWLGGIQAPPPHDDEHQQSK